MRVHYDEGVAIHIGPESCAGGREAVREALTGECAGQPLSHEKADIPGADAVRYAEGHTKGRAIASSPTTRRGRRPWHVQSRGAGEKHDRGRGQRMLAGIVLGLSRGLPLHEDARFGMAAGAAALLGSGTKLCRRADVERLYNDGSC